MIVFNKSTGYINYLDGKDSSWYELRPSDPRSQILNYFLSLPNGIQALLNAGETPNNLLEVGVAHSDMIGKQYAGGLIFYLDSRGKGLVVSPSDQSSSIAWGCDGIPIEGADGTMVGSGLPNSLDIASGCMGSSSAKTCLDLFLNGFADWYLPSQDELDLIWENLGDSDGNGNNEGPADINNIGAFQPGIYWCSSGPMIHRPFFKALAMEYKEMMEKRACTAYAPFARFDFLVFTTYPLHHFDN